MTVQPQTVGDLEPFPLSIKPMLTRLVDEPFSDPKWVFEPKLDGFRILAFVRKGQVTLLHPDDSGVGPDFPLPRRAL